MKIEYCIFRHTLINPIKMSRRSPRIVAQIFHDATRDSSLNCSDDEFHVCNQYIARLTKLALSKSTVEEKTEILSQLFVYVYSNPRYLAVNRRMQALILKEVEECMKRGQLSDNLRDICLKLRDLLS